MKRLLLFRGNIRGPRPPPYQSISLHPQKKLRPTQQQGSLLRRGIPSVQDTEDKKGIRASGISELNDGPAYGEEYTITGHARLLSPRPSEGAQIDRLPNEVLCAIFENLRTSRSYPTDAKFLLYDVIRVCRRWLQLGLPFLWKDIYLASFPDSNAPHGDRLSVSLDLYPSVWSNLEYVRRLRLRFYNNHYLVSSVQQCESILQRIGRMTRVLDASSGVRSLWVRFDPFIPSDCEDIRLWPIVKQANDLMQTAAFTILQRSDKLEQLEISLGREEYRYEERGREEADTLLRILLRSSVTHMSLYESSLTQVNQWLGELTQLRRLRLALHENHLEDRTTGTSEFWNHVCRMGTEALELPSGFPPSGEIPKWHNLKKIVISHLDSSLDVAQLVFSHMPQLEICGINRSADRNIDPSQIPIFQGDVLSTTLSNVTFKESVVPGGLLRQIAMASGPALEIAVMPRNGVDDDMEIIVANCPNLRKINLSYSPLVGEQGLRAIKRAKQLLSLELHWCHLKLLRKDQILETADACPELVSIAISTPHRRTSRARRLGVKQLHSKSLRRWLGNFLSIDSKTYSIIIHLDWIREFNAWRVQSRCSERR